MLPANRIGVLAYERIGCVATRLPDGSHNPTTLMVVSSPRHILRSDEQATPDLISRPSPVAGSAHCVPSRAQFLQLCAHRFPAKTLFETVTLLTSCGSLNVRPVWMQLPMEMPLSSMPRSLLGRGATWAMALIVLHFRCIFDSRTWRQPPRLRVPTTFREVTGGRDFRGEMYLTERSMFGPSGYGYLRAVMRSTGEAG